MQRDFRAGFQIGLCYAKGLGAGFQIVLCYAKGFQGFQSVLCYAKGFQAGFQTVLCYAKGFQGRPIILMCVRSDGELCPSPVFTPWAARLAEKNHA